MSIRLTFMKGIVKHVVINARKSSNIPKTTVKKFPVFF